MTRLQRADSELVQASEHVWYEAWMMSALARELGSRGKAGDPIGNALIEAFVIHLRGLLDFLYAPKSLRDDDMVAEDFEPLWSAHRPAVTSVLSAARDRANKEIAHLSYTRIAVLPRDKAWNYTAISKDINDTLLKFVALVPSHRLCARWASGWQI